MQLNPYLLFDGQCEAAFKFYERILGGKIEAMSCGETNYYGGLMRYVDGFVLPVPEKNLPLYRGIAQKAGKIWREYGALQYVEAVGDDLDNKFGVPFTKTIKLKPGETVVFSWIVYKSRAHRDQVNAKVMKDPRMAKMMEKGPMPFEVKRMVYGGFKFLVDA